MLASAKAVDLIIQPPPTAEHYCRYADFLYPEILIAAVTASRLEPGWRIIKYLAWPAKLHHQPYVSYTDQSLYCPKDCHAWKIAPYTTPRANQVLVVALRLGAVMHDECWRSAEM